MKIKYPGYSRRFLLAEDEILFNYDIDYEHDKRFVLARLQILKLVWNNDASTTDNT
ncbi:MAG: hypothetical protein OEX79_10120 [Nitrosopumilus sp.]|nr:hypothetical protein [Nitrosopumilus sp.]MDH5555536.1 hypothetical protein [Nitrosopumilus sp.]